MTQTHLRSALLAASLILGFAACSNTPITNDGGTTSGASSTTTTGTTTSSTTTTTGGTTTTTTTAGTTTTGTTGTGTTGTGTTGTGTTTGTSTGQGNTGSIVQLRAANFAPGMGAPVDICYINNDDTAAGWQGPLFALGGEPQGVPYPGISGYESVSGPLDITDVKVIPGPITNVANACIDAGTVGNVTFVAPPNGGGHLILGANKSGTLAVEGFGGSGNFKLSVFAYTDELSTNSATASIFRFVNSSPVAGTYDFGTDLTNLLVTGASFGTFGNSTNADSAGFQPFTSDGGIYSFEVSQLGSGIQEIDNVNMGAGNGYSFFYGTDQNSANPWAFFCNDSVSSAPYTFCYWPDGGTLILTDAGF